MGDVYCQAVATARRNEARGIRTQHGTAPTVMSSPAPVASAMVAGLLHVQAQGQADTIAKSPRAEYMREYRAAHKAEIAAYTVAYDKKYNAAHSEEKKARAKEYRATHKEEIVAYHVKHKAEIAAYEAARREDSAERNRKWCAAHPDKRRLNQRKRCALKYGNTPIAELLTEAQWRDILDEYHHRCVYCGKKSDHLTMDHVIPLSKGGKHSANNVVPACGHCNSTKGARTPEQWGGVHV